MTNPSPCFLIDPLGNPNSRVEELKSQVYNGGLAHLIGMFESVATLKERLSSKDPYSEHSMRRITHISPDADHRFLMENLIIHGQSCSPETTLADACKEMQESFYKPPRNDEYMRVFGKEPNPKEVFNPLRGVPIVNERELFIPDRISQAFEDKHMCIEVDFLEGLSTPQKHTPLEEILRFKERYSAEYEAFWDCLRDLALDIEYFNSPAKREKIQRKISKNIGDYEKIMAESWGRRVVNTAKFNYVLDGKEVAAFASLGAFLNFFGVTPLIFAIGALPGLKITLNLRPSRSPLEGDVAAMSYISNLKRVR